MHPYCTLASAFHFPHSRPRTKQSTLSVSPRVAVCTTQSGIVDSLQPFVRPSSPRLLSIMRRFLVSVAQPALRARPLSSSTSYLRPFATSTTSGGGKSNAPSTQDGDASRRTGDYGPADGDKKPLEQEGQGGKGGATGGDVGQRSSSTSSTSSTKKASTPSQPKRGFASSSSSKTSATHASSDPASANKPGPAGKQTSQADAAEKTKAGKDPTHHSPTPTPDAAQKRKASGKSAVAGQSATEVHRKQEEYTAHRDLATGAEMNVAADRAAHDPLPDKLKHSTKVNKS